MRRAQWPVEPPPPTPKASDNYDPRFPEWECLKCGTEVIHHEGKNFCPVCDRYVEAYPVGGGSKSNPRPRPQMIGTINGRVLSPCIIKGKKCQFDGTTRGLTEVALKKGLKDGDKLRADYGGGMREYVVVASGDRLGHWVQRVGGGSSNPRSSEPAPLVRGQSAWYGPPMSASDKAQMVNDYHTARTAVGDKRYDRMQLVARWWGKKEGWTEGWAYKAIDRLLAPEWV